jgi:hypothetical protein
LAKSHSSSSARIIASEVSTPCPISDLATRSVIELSGSMATKALTSGPMPASEFEGSPEICAALQREPLGSIGDAGLTNIARKAPAARAKCRVAKPLTREQQRWRRALSPTRPRQL